MVENKPRLTNVVEDMNESDDILLASPVTLSPGLLPYRYVLRRLANQYVTHREYVVITTHVRPMDKYDTAVHVIQMAHDGYDLGNYFPFTNEADRVRASELSRADFHRRAYGK